MDGECVLHTFERIKSRIKFKIFKTPPTEKNVLHEKRNFLLRTLKIKPFFQSLFLLLHYMASLVRMCKLEI